MNNIETYLNEHKVKKFPNCIHYRTLKACILGSLDKKLTYYKNDTYCYDGEIENIGYKQKTKDKELPLFSPYVNQKL